MNLNLSDKEFKKKYSKFLFETSNNCYGKYKTQIPFEKPKGLNGKFTSALLASGMYKNNSLDTHIEKERYIDGSKDWMDHLN